MEVGINKSSEIRNDGIKWENPYFGIYYSIARVKHAAMHSQLSQEQTIKKKRVAQLPVALSNINSDIDIW